VTAGITHRQLSPREHFVKLPLRLRSGVNYLGTLIFNTSLSFACITRDIKLWFQRQKQKKPCAVFIEVQSLPCEGGVIYGGFRCLECKNEYLNNMDKFSRMYRTSDSHQLRLPLLLKCEYASRLLPCVLSRAVVAAQPGGIAPGLGCAAAGGAGGRGAAMPGW